MTQSILRLLLPGIALCGIHFFSCNGSPTKPVTYEIDPVDSAQSFTVPLAIRTSLNAPRTSVSNYGNKPQIAVIGNSDNSFDVALYLSTSSQIQILFFDAAGVKTGEIIPASINGAGALLGFTKITDDGSFAAAWSKDNSFGDQDFEYWITRFDRFGTEVFSSRIFGDISSATVESEGEPGDASSGRLAYNAVTKKICYYCGHSRLWSDGVRHQGGHIGFIDLTGIFYTTNSWFYSHNFDQRLIVVDSFYYALAQGDAYPRALGFSKWKDVLPAGKKLVDFQYFPIEGSTGDNTTNCQTGGIIPLSDGNFGILFSTSINRSTFDVCYKKVSPDGNLLSTNWLTNYQNTSKALYPRIARRGADVFAAWERVISNTISVHTRILDCDGNPLSAQGMLDSVELSPWYDLVTLPNGDIIWAYTKSSDSLKICRIPGSGT